MENKYYMCKVDYECELGLNYYGNMVYPSIKSLKENRPCVEQCGIVEIKIELIRVISDSKYGE